MLGCWASTRPGELWGWCDRVCVEAWEHGGPEAHPLMPVHKAGATCRRKVRRCQAGTDCGGGDDVWWLPLEHTAEGLGPQGRRRRVSCDSGRVWVWSSGQNKTKPTVGGGAASRSPRLGSSSEDFRGPECARKEGRLGRWLRAWRAGCS